MRFLFFFMIVSFFFSLSAVDLKNYRQNYIYRIEDKVHKLSYIHLNNSQGEPVILSHSLMFNGYVMYHWANLLYELGFDVWIPHARGHGPNDLERTFVENEKEGDYFFEKMVIEDAHAFVQLIRKNNPRPLIIMGHSMGGMIWERYLSGLIRDDETKNYRQSQEVAMQRSRGIKCFILMASPSQFVPLKGKMRDFISKIQFLSKLGSFVLPLKYFEKEHTFIPHKVTTFLREKNKNFLMKNIPEGVINIKNIKKDSYFKDHFFKEASSEPHSEYLKQFAHFALKGEYLSLDRKVDYAKDKKIYVPTLYLVGTLDLLALPKNVLETLSSYYPARTPLHLFKVKNYTHFDFLMSEGVELLKNLVVSFIINPEEIIESNVRSDDISEILSH